MNTASINDDDDDDHHADKNKNTPPIATSDRTVAVKIRNFMLDTNKPRTVMQNFDKICLRLGPSPALFQEKKITSNTSRGSTSISTPMEWNVWTWNQYRESVNAFGKSLIALKCQKFDCINIIGFNSPQWFFSNFGAIAAGLIPAGIYSTNKADACHYISKHSNAKVVVCDGIEQLEKYYSDKFDSDPSGSSQLQSLKALILYGSDTLPVDIQEKCSVPCYTFDEFLQLGVNVTDNELQERSNSWEPGETCTLIYTSGTTGPPKAVMITNDNITWTASVMISSVSKGYMDEQDCMVSYLPLSHIAAQMLDMHAPMITGCQIYFANPDALKGGTLVKTLTAVCPTVFFGVPRVYEKIYDKLQEVAKTTTGLTKIVSSWAKAEAAAYWESLQYESSKSSSFHWNRDIPIAYYMAKAVLHQVHKKLGFDRCTDFFVSAAPIDVKILKYFASLDIPIMELFGQSECTGPHSINTIHAYKVGTVGRPMPGTETKLDPLSGELLYRGRHIFAGYMGMPEQTNETIDIKDGWLHSGDVATIDDDTDETHTTGFIKITGRIKELIITAGGENIPPVLIEEQLKLSMPALSYAMVIGDQRKYLTVLLTLQVKIDQNDGSATNKLDRQALATSIEIGSTATTTAEVLDCSKWHAYFMHGIAVANTKATSRAQMVQKYSLLPTDFTEKGNEWTPTLKLKRAVTAQKYASYIDAMYNDTSVISS